MPKWQQIQNKTAMYDSRDAVLCYTLHDDQLNTASRLVPTYVLLSLTCCKPQHWLTSSKWRRRASN